MSAMRPDMRPSARRRTLITRATAGLPRSHRSDEYSARCATGFCSPSPNSGSPKSPTVRCRFPARRPVYPTRSGSWHDVTRSGGLRRTHFPPDISGAPMFPAMREEPTYFPSGTVNAHEPRRSRRPSMWRRCLMPPARTRMWRAGADPGPLAAGQSRPRPGYRPRHRGGAGVRRIIAMQISRPAQSCRMHSPDDTAAG